jgi:hypothetical protein
MTTLGQFLQIAGLLIAPLGLLHYTMTRDYLAEGALMTWELGCLLAGALCFLLGRRLARGRE